MAEEFKKTGLMDGMGESWTSFNEKYALSDGNK